MSKKSHKAYVHFNTITTDLKKYVDEIRVAYKFVRGSNKRAVQLLEAGKEFISTTTPRSILGAMTILMEQVPGRKAIKEVRLVIDEFSPVYEYAKFVEFGTGFVGAGESYDFLEQYGDHPMAEKVGWHYGIGSDEYGGDNFDNAEGFWVYKAKDGRYITTAGQRPNAFMYRIYLYVSRVIAQHRKEENLGILRYNQPLITSRRWYKVKFGVDETFSPYVAIVMNKNRWKYEQ